MTIDESFVSLGLSPQLLQALDLLNFKTPSPIQQQTIPWLLQGRHLIGQAQTGTGKTAAFALPILQQLDLDLPAVQALILAPTRELAIQVGSHFEALGQCLGQTKVAVICGGQDYRPQLKRLKEGAHVVVGTPGRILDHLNRGSLQLGRLKTFVLDEADEMLRMGFIEDVENILAKLPTVRQIALFSATMPARIRQIANSYLQDPVAIEIHAETATVKSVEQKFIFVQHPQKTALLLRVLAASQAQGVIVFVKTKSSTEEIAQVLQQHGHKAMAINGDMVQSLRERVITQFKQGVIDVLVATDVAARGLDVDRVTHVINYDIAHDCETYVHRIGRTGRAGRSGVTILFVTPKESRMLNIIERHTRQRIEKIAVPNDQAIQQARTERFLGSISARLAHENLSDYRDMIAAYVQEQDLSIADVAAVLALMLHHDQAWKVELPGFKEAKPAQETRHKEDHMHKASRRGGGMREHPPVTRNNKRFQSMDGQALYRLDVGRIHGVKPGNIVGAIANEAGLQSRHITELKINDDHSTVCLPKGMSKEVIHALNKARVCGRQLKLTSVDS